MGRDKVDLFARIRDDRRLLGLGIRELAGKYGVHRRLVREALASPVPAPRKRPSRESPVLDAVAGLIDGMLREDLDAPRKQRHTSRRIWQRLADEHDAEVSYSYVCQYAGQRRAQIEAEHRAAAAGVEGFVPQAKEPGAEAEVDFGQVSVVVGGDQAACHLFAYRLSYSGKGVHRVYASCAQEAFLEGHVTAFEVTGGVPSGQIRYDNLSPAVAKVLAGRSRTETARWLAFRAFRVRGVLLPARPGGRARERRGRGGDRPVPPPLVRAGAAGRVAGGAECPAGRGGRRRGRPAHRRAGGHDRGGLRCRAGPAAAVAARAVHHRYGLVAAGGPVCAGQRREVPVFGAGPADRIAGPGDAVGERAAGL